MFNPIAHQITAKPRLTQEEIFKLIEDYRTSLNQGIATPESVKKFFDCVNVATREQFIEAWTQDASSIALISHEPQDLILGSAAPVFFGRGPCKAERFDRELCPSPSWKHGAQWTPNLCRADSIAHSKFLGGRTFLECLPRYRFRFANGQSLLEEDFTAAFGFDLENDVLTLPGQRERLAWIEAFDLPIFGGVHSGNKSEHAFFRFDHVYDLPPGDPLRAAFLEAWRFIAAAFGGDLSVCTLRHEMRFPAWIHPESLRVQPLIEFNPRASITLAHLLDIAPRILEERVKELEGTTDHASNLLPSIEAAEKIRNQLKGCKTQVLKGAQTEEVLRWVERIEPLLHRESITLRNEIDRLETHLRAGRDLVKDPSGQTKTTSTPRASKPRQASTPRASNRIVYDEAQFDLLFPSNRQHKHRCPLCDHDSVTILSRNQNVAICNACGGYFSKPQRIDRARVKGVEYLPARFTSKQITLPDGTSKDLPQLLPWQDWGAHNFLNVFCGAGKSEAEIEIIAQNIASDPEAAHVVIIPKRALVSQFDAALQAVELNKLKGLGFTSYLQEGEIITPEEAAALKRVLVTPDSLWRFAHLRPKFLYVEECTETFWAVLKKQAGNPSIGKGDNVAKRMTLSFEALLNWIHRIGTNEAPGSRAFYLDAWLPEETIKSVQDIAQAPIRVFETPSGVLPLQGKTIESIDPRRLEDLISELIESRVEGVAFFALNKAQVETIASFVEYYSKALGVPVKVEGFTGENHPTKPLNEIAKELNWFIYNTTCGSGVSITDPRYKVSVALVPSWGLEPGSTVESGCRTLIQALQRCRAASRLALVRSDREPRSFAPSLEDNFRKERNRLQEMFFDAQAASNTDKFSIDAFSLNHLVPFAAHNQTALDADKIDIESRVLSYFESLGAQKIASSIAHNPALDEIDLRGKAKGASNERLARDLATLPPEEMEIIRARIIATSKKAPEEIIEEQKRSLARTGYRKEPRIKHRIKAAFFAGLCLGADREVRRAKTRELKIRNDEGGLPVVTALAAKTNYTDAASLLEQTLLCIPDFKERLNERATLDQEGIHRSDVSSFCPHKIEHRPSIDLFNKAREKGGLSRIKDPEKIFDHLERQWKKLFPGALFSHSEKRVKAWFIDYGVLVSLLEEIAPAFALIFATKRGPLFDRIDPEEVELLPASGKAAAAAVALHNETIEAAKHRLKIDNKRIEYAPHHFFRVQNPYFDSMEIDSRDPRFSALHRPPKGEEFTDFVAHRLFCASFGQPFPPDPSPLALLGLRFMRKISSVLTQRKRLRREELRILDGVRQCFTNEIGLINLEPPEVAQAIWNDLSASS